MKRWTPALALACIVGATSLNAAPHGEGAGAGAATRVERDEIQGLVRPNRQVTLNPSLVAKVQEIFADESQAVKAGTLLVQLDAAVQEAVVAHAEAAWQQAKLVLESTRHMHTAAAATNFEARRAELEAEQAAATLRLERERLALYALKAPFDGTVLRILAREGSTVGEDKEVIAFAELDPLIAEFQLPASMWREIAVGAPYRLYAGAPVESEITAYCQTRDPAIDPASGTFRCVLRIENPAAKLPSGFPISWGGAAPTMAER